MNIKLNTKPADVTVYDKDNYKHASNKEVVSLIGSINGDFKERLIDLISAGLRLNESEKELYKCISVYSSEVLVYQHSIIVLVSINHILERCTDVYGKSITTYKRAIDILIRTGVIRYVESNRVITLNPAYDVNAIADIAKYIVIEVHTT